MNVATIVVVALCHLIPALGATWQPQATIITSVFKGDQFIEGFLQNIVRQTYFDRCEFIIINAASPGNEDAIITKYAQQYPNIVYARLDRDPGLYAVWNLAIYHARAPYISNWNIDDRRPAYSLELQIKALDEHPEADLVYSDILISYVPNQLFEQCHPQARCQVPDFLPETLDRCLPGPCPMWRKNVHATCGYFDDWFTSAADWEFWNRMVRNGSKFYKIPAPCGAYYVNPTGVSTTPDPVKAAVRAKEEQLVVRRYQQYWKKNA